MVHGADIDVLSLAAYLFKGGLLLLAVEPTLWLPALFIGLAWPHRSRFWIACAAGVPAVFLFRWCDDRFMDYRAMHLPGMVYVLEAGQLMVALAASIVVVTLAWAFVRTALRSVRRRATVAP